MHFRSTGTKLSQFIVRFDILYRFLPGAQKEYVVHQFKFDILHNSSKIKQGKEHIDHHKQNEKKPDHSTLSAQPYYF